MEEKNKKSILVLRLKIQGNPASLWLRSPAFLLDNMSVTTLLSAPVSAERQSTQVIVARAPMICRFPNYNTRRSPHFVLQSRSTDSAASCAVIMQLPKRQNRRAISCTECRRRKQKVPSSLTLLRFLYQAKDHQLINHSVFRTNMVHVQIVLDDTPQWNVF
jgi:hypothetical protein